MAFQFARAYGIIRSISIAWVTILLATGIARGDGIDLPRKAVVACSPITLTCENARTYGLCPIAVTDVGELVTATLSPGLTHVRAIPMGNGYRYAGRGIWFDGKGPVGRLYFGHSRSVACTVSW